MSYAEFSSQMRELFYGNLLLVLCCFFYLAWWIVAFRPGARTGTMVQGILLAAAILSGAAALFLVIKGINTMPYSKAIIPSRYLIWGGIVTYIFLFIITSFLMERQVTTELLLILGWAVLEFSVLNVLYGAGQLSLRFVIFLVVFIVAAVIASLVCYLLYYRLEGKAAYVDGMIPLITEAVTMLIFAVLMLVRP